jgi:phosphatidylinositol 3-kinase
VGTAQDIAMDPDKCVGKVQEKFLLEMEEEQAVERFQEQLDESLSAMFAVFVEKIHTWAQYWRK